MIRLLTSVVNRQEALLALQAGADIIDFKNPAQGALGALPLPLITEAVHEINGKAWTSATVGDLPMRPELLIPAIESTAATGVDFIKIGFFGNGDYEACLARLRPLTINGLKLIAVLFADCAPDMTLLPELQAAGFYGVMLDTAIKNGNSLLDHISVDELQSFVTQAQSHALHCGLAGSLRIAHTPILTRLQPDYLGFRGALCVDSRRVAALSESRVKELYDMLHKYNRCTID